MQSVPKNSPIKKLQFDINQALGDARDFSEKLNLLFEHTNRQFPCVSSIEIILHDSDTDLLKSFATSGTFDTDSHYRCPSRLSDKKILCKVAAESKASLIKDGDYLQSGLIVPFTIGGKFGGFIFLNAQQEDRIFSSKIEQLNIYAQLISQLVISELRSITSLKSSILTLLSINNINKSESAAHLKRVAHYSTMIAQQVANRYSLSNAWIEHLFMFAPLHDIGKIFISKNILSKPGKLSIEEFDKVKLHTVKGREMIDSMIDSFGYSEDHHLDILRNIVMYHHEAMDGSGYPEALAGDEIPIEARIVAVADVLDALMTKRVYKEAWSLEEALSAVQEMADRGKLDPCFVDALIARKEHIMGIRQALAA